MNENYFQNKNILVVDDEELIREILIDFFKELGAEQVLEAANGKQAFEILQKIQIDLVLSDIRMPDGDGITLLKDIRQNLDYLPLLFLCTGFSDFTEQEALNLGALHVFNKPFKLKDIKERLLLIISNMKT